MCCLRNIAMCDYRTDRQTDGQTDRHWTKWSLSAAMLRRWHKWVSLIFQAYFKHKNLAAWEGFVLLVIWCKQAQSERHSIPDFLILKSHFGTCICSNVETNFPKTCRVYGLSSFDIPWYFYFTWICCRTGSFTVMHMVSFQPNHKYNVLPNTPW